MADGLAPRFSAVGSRYFATVFHARLLGQLEAHDTTYRCGDLDSTSLRILVWALWTSPRPSAPSA